MLHVIIEMRLSGAIITHTHTHTHAHAHTQGSIQKIEYPFHHSNVQHFSKEKNVRSRIGKKFLENGKKVRYLMKTGEILD